MHWNSLFVDKVMSNLISSSYYVHISLNNVNKVHTGAVISIIKDESLNRELEWFQEIISINGLGGTLKTLGTSNIMLALND